MYYHSWSNFLILSNSPVEVKVIDHLNRSAFGYFKYERIYILEIQYNQWREEPIWDSTRNGIAIFHLKIKLLTWKHHHSNHCSIIILFLSSSLRHSDKNNCMEINFWGWSKKINNEPWVREIHYCDKEVAKNTLLLYAINKKWRD